MTANRQAHNENISITEASAKIAEAVGRPDETPRQANSRVRNGILYQFERGRLQQIAGKMVRAGEVFAWAQESWPEAAGVHALPADPQTIDAKLRAGFSVEAFLFPGNVAECHQQMMHQVRRIQELESQLEDSEKRAAKRERASEKGRFSAKKNRSPL